MKLIQNSYLKMEIEINQTYFNITHMKCLLKRIMTRPLITVTQKVLQKLKRWLKCQIFQIELLALNYTLLKEVK